MTEKIFKRGNRRKLFSVTLTVMMVVAVLPMSSLTTYAYDSLPTQINGYEVNWPAGWCVDDGDIVCGNCYECIIRQDSGYIMNINAASGSNPSWVTELTIGTYICGDCGATFTLSEPSGSTPDSTPTPSESAPAPDMKTVNIEGSTLNTWEEIVAHTPDLTAEKLQKVNHSDDALLHVNIVGKDNKTVPVAAVTAMDNSTIEGLHVFIGEGDAITFFNVFDNTGYTGKNFTHKADITETEKVIEFEDTGKLNTIIAFHTLILPNRAAKVYKVVDGVEVFVGSTVSIDNGGICFAIDELTKYIIRY